jgi:AcrR family transcriptional regulator
MTPSVTGTDTRGRILAAAVRRIASEGIDGVRIARIAMDAGVSASLVHYHFDTREDLLAQALQWSYEHTGGSRIDLDHLDVTSHAERLGAIVDQCLPLTTELREDWVLWIELWLRAVRHPEMQPVAEEMYAKLREWFEQEIVDGVVDGEFQECEPAEVADRTMALLDGLGVRHLIGDRAITLEVARAIVTTSLARDLGIEPHRLDSVVRVT